MHIVQYIYFCYVEMVMKLDDSLGRVISALGDKGLLKNSVILFLSDNGAAPIGKFRNWGSNWPLRGVSILCKFFIMKLIFLL